jgi:uncharacterized membrane protein
MMQWYFYPVGSWGISLSAILLLLPAVWLCGIPGGRLSARRTTTITSLRVLTLILLGLAMLRPTLVHSITKRQAATLAILVDQSRSMETKDLIGGKSRWEAAKTLLADAAPQLQSLQQESEMQIKPFLFAGEPTPISMDRGKLQLPDAPEGEETALGLALQELLRQFAGQRMAGIVCISDGAERARGEHAIEPQLVARRFGDLGCPIYTVTLGQTRAAGGRDAAVRDLNVNPTVYAKNEMNVHATVQLSGWAGKRVPVALLWEGKNGKMLPVAVKSLEPRTENEEVAVDLTFSPQNVGEYRLAVRVEPPDEDQSPANNELTTYVTVLAGGVKVLFVEGNPTPEQYFLLRSLDGSPDIRPEYVALRPRGNGNGSASNLAALLRSQHFDAVIFRDLDASLVSKEDLAAIAALVHQGLGLAMLGGLHSFGPGGYAETPLADLLPIRMDPLERQRLGEAVRPDVHLPGPITMLPAKTPSGKHSLMSLGGKPDEVLRLWKSLPPLDGANRFKGIKPAAQVLAETPDGAPLLAIQEAGGRVLAFGGDSTWHWCMEGKDESHRRFWRQVVLWLAQKEEDRQQPVFVRLSERRLAPGARLEINVSLHEQGDAITAQGKTECEVTMPDGSKQAVSLVASGEKSVGSFSQTSAPGEYSVAVQGFGSSGKALGNSTARFLVHKRDLELENPAADPNRMANIATATAKVGGKVLQPEELSSLLQEIRRQPVHEDITIARKDTYWDTWPFFLLVVSTLSLEWFLRKRWGLV